MQTSNQVGLKKFGIEFIREMERNVAGTNCVGLGSDFDGIPGHGDLQDASYLPKLAQGLEDSGLSYKTIEKIFYKNVFNLYKEVLI